jgi:hypothetical protein
MVVMQRGIQVGIVTLALVVGGCQLVSADRFSSTSYVIDASVASSNGGGSGSSTSYKLVTSTGETAIGYGTAGSYRMGMGFVSQLEKSLSLTVQPSGLVATYSLDDPSGTLISDQSVYATYGQFQGTLSSVAGKIDTALSFNGSSQAVSIASNSQTQLSSAGTLEAWIKSSTTTGTLAAVTKSSAYWLGLSAGKAALYDWTSSTTCVDSTTIADGAWHHVVVTLSSGVTNGSIIYVDGVQKKTCTWTPVSQTGYVAIGAVQTGVSTYSQYFNGSIDHVKILNRALTADDVLAEYNGQNAGAASGLSLGTITPGASNAVLSDVIVQTDAGSYTLAISQDHNLTSGAYTIPSISGSIASPLSWSEGSTKGLGFTLTTTNASALPGTWNSGNSYAQFPSTATTFYTRTGQPSSNDYLTMRVRADVATTQASSGAPYTNTITVTGTVTP